MSGHLPDFLIIGAMRSGTTSLAVNLGNHPEIFIPPEKEVRFFDRHFDEGMPWYEDRFARAPAGAIVGEASPGYMYHHSARERMAEALPDARLVAILREPVERAYSHYWLNRSLGIEPLSFAQAVDREPIRLANGERPDAFGYLARGRFLAQLQAVCEHYERDRLLVLLFDDLQGDPGGTYRRTCAFLGIDQTYEPRALGRPINPYVQFRSLPVRGAARDLPSPARRLLERVNTRRSVSYPPLDPELQAELRSRFRDENRQLEIWLGRDLHAWNGPVAPTR